LKSFAKELVEIDHFWCFGVPKFGTLSAVNALNYHDGKSKSGSLTSFAPIIKLYLLTARCYIHDHFDQLWPFKRCAKRHDKIIAINWYWRWIGRV